MAKNKDIEEGSQGINATSNEPKTDQKKTPIHKTRSGHVIFPFVEASDRSSEAICLWPPSDNHKYCCIYRVPCRLKKVNPKAYTPQMLLIGPLHHCKKVEDAKLNNIELSYFDYMKMERHKVSYLKNFTLSCGEQTVEEFRRIIGRDEEIIKACYAEKIDCIDSSKFIEMMLLDSVFIFVYFLQLGSLYTKKTGDFLFDEPSYQTTIFEDLILLENQLPYFLLEKLFEPVLTKRGASVTFRDIVLEGFKFKGKIRKEVEFLHFTDLYRRVRVETLGLSQKEESNKKGVIRNWMGHEGSIAEMVNKLCLGVVDYGSNYYDIAKSLNNHCKSYLNKSVATLWRVYFKDLWTGTATIGAFIILVLTLIGTVASVLQVKNNANDSPTPPPPPPPAWKH